MLVTEKEACTLWCPIINSRTGSRVAAPGLLVEFMGPCMGSRCMAWRWSGNSNRRAFIQCSNGVAETESRPLHVPESYLWCPWNDADGEPAGWVEPEEEYLDRRTGCCGLAGVVK